MTELLSCARLRQGETKELVITADEDGGEIEISVIYFRATYTPNDFPSEAHWELRAMLEESKAIKCPSLPLQVCPSLSFSRLYPTR
jgi:glutathione synthase